MVSIVKVRFSEIEHLNKWSVKDGVHLTHVKKYPCWVALIVDGKVVGCGGFRMATRTRAHFGGWFILKEYRSLGYGWGPDGIVEACKEWAKHLGVVTMTAWFLHPAAAAEYGWTLCPKSNWNAKIVL